MRKTAISPAPRVGVEVFRSQSVSGAPYTEVSSRSSELECPQIIELNMPWNTAALRLCCILSTLLWSSGKRLLYGGLVGRVAQDRTTPNLFATYFSHLEPIVDFIAT